MKRFALPLSLVMSAALSGCSLLHQTQPAKAQKQSQPLQKKPQQTEVNSTPAANEPKNSASTLSTLSGKVAAYNSAGQFAVLDFSVGKMPALEQTVFVYRAGKKVGVLKVSGPTRDNNTVADLISGEVQKGDDVHER